jgi:hypothetical protein
MNVEFLFSVSRFSPFDLLCSVSCVILFFGGGGGGGWAVALMNAHVH